MKVDFGARRRGDARADFAHAPFDQIALFRIGATRGPGKLHFGGHDRDALGVAPVDRGDRHDRGSHRIDRTGNDRLQRSDQNPRSHDGVHRLVGTRPVSAHALHGDEEMIGRGALRALREADHAERKFARAVHAVDFVDGETLEEAVLDHFPRPGIPFLTRLNDEDDVAREIFAALHKRMRGQKDAGYVTVVPAGVHAVFDDRSPGMPRMFFERQRVHVGAKRDRDKMPGISLAAADHRGDAGLADPFDDFVAAHGAQRVGRDLGRADFAHAEFGMGVQVAADRRHGVKTREDFREQVFVESGHIRLLPCEDAGRRRGDSGPQAD